MKTLSLNGLPPTNDHLVETYGEILQSIFGYDIIMLRNYQTAKQHGLFDDGLINKLISDGVLSIANYTPGETGGIEVTFELTALGYVTKTMAIQMKLLSGAAYYQRDIPQTIDIDGDSDSEADTDQFGDTSRLAQLLRRATKGEGIGSPTLKVPQASVTAPVAEPAAAHTAAPEIEPSEHQASHSYLDSITPKSQELAQIAIDEASEPAPAVLAMPAPIESEDEVLELERSMSTDHQVTDERPALPVVSSDDAETDILVPRFIERAREGNEQI